MSSEGYVSVLFRSEEDASAVGGEDPDFFVDLNLDQVVADVVREREQYDLAPFFRLPLDDLEAVLYRHEVVRDLECAAIMAPIRSFAERMRQMRAAVEQAGQLHYRRQKEAWFRDAVEVYCDAVRQLAESLRQAPVGGRALAGVCAHVLAYAASDAFTTLAAEAEELKDALAEIEYAVQIAGARVTVSRFEGEPDYSREVEEVFSRFKQGAVRGYLARLLETADMDHVEARILDLVARLFPKAFADLTAFCERHADFVEPAIARFDREIQFYLAYLDFADRLGAWGLRFSLPSLAASAEESGVDDCFDLALAAKLSDERRKTVTNGFRLTGAERIVVVTGPNNGGKTTFARMFGQVHYVASLGLPVPGANAQLMLPERIFTHFEREESIETLRGKLEDELVRVRDVLEAATDRSVIVMNESFSSTTLADSLLLGTEVLNRIDRIGALAVYVTFVDELASLGDATISMVSEIVPDNPSERTFRVVRRPADGLAYADAIARKYGLEYERLMERIAS